MSSLKGSGGKFHKNGYLITPQTNRLYMPEYPKKQNSCSPDAYLDEQDLKDIAESEEDIRMGRVYTQTARV